MVSAGNCAGTMASFIGPKASATWANWTRQLHSNVEANHTHLAGEIGPR